MSTKKRAKRSSPTPPAKKAKKEDALPYYIETPNLVTEEEWEKEEDRVRLEVMRKIVYRKREVTDKTLDETELNRRQEEEKQRTLNRETVRRWRDRYGIHRTLHHLDRMRKMNKANETLSRKLRKVVEDVEKSKKKLEKDVRRNEKNPTASKERLEKIRNWLKRVPEVLSKAKKLGEMTDPEKDGISLARRTSQRLRKVRVASS